MIRRPWLIAALLATVLAVATAVWRSVHGLFPWQQGPSIDRLESLIGQEDLTGAASYVSEWLEWAHHVHGDEVHLPIEFLCGVPRAFIPQGKLAHATTYIDVALLRMNAVHGAHHPQTIDYLHRMSVELIEWGYPEEAELYLGQAVESARNAYADGDRRYLEVLATQITLQCLRGAVSPESMQQIEHAMVQCRQTLGEKDLLTVRWTMLKGFAALHSGDFGGSRELAVEALRQLQEIGPSGTVEVRALELVLAMALLAAGDVDGVESVVYSAYRDCRRLPERHPVKQMSRVLMALLLVAQGSIEEADAIGRRVLDTCDRSRCHPYLDGLARLVVIELDLAQGNHLAAEQGLHRLRDVCQRLPANGVLLRGYVESTLCALLMEDGRFEAAAQACTSALELAEAAYGPIHPDTIAELRSIAELHIKRREPHQAEARYRLALARSLESASLTGPDIADCHIGLAHAAAMQGRLTDAERQLRVAKGIVEQQVALDGDAAESNGVMSEAELLAAVVRAAMSTEPEEIDGKTLQEAVSYARRAVEANRRAEPEYLSLLAIAHWYQGDRSAAVVSQREALEQAWRIGAPDEEIAQLTELLNSFRTEALPRTAVGER